MGFTEDKLVCIYKSLTLSQYMYCERLLPSTSTRAKKEMQAQQRRFLSVIGISTERDLLVHNIKPMEVFLNKQYVNKTRTIPSRPASIATNTTKTSLCRIPTPHNTKTWSCRRASASFAMGMSINTRTQDESKRPRQHITSRSK